MKHFGFLSNNLLKIIAAITMLIDHIGVIFFPQVKLLRIIGRISFPIFAFMVAEGCYYTRNRTKHVLLLSSFAIIMQAILYITTRMTNFSIFMSFTLSTIIIYMVDFTDDSIRKRKLGFATIGFVALMFIITYLFIFTTKYNYFFSNYNYLGIMAPVILYVFKKYFPKYSLYINVFVLGVLLTIFYVKTKLPLQIYSLLSLPIILLYNGKRGKYNIKYFFYFFYPFHLALLYFIKMLIGG